jgi:hypothetical protein
MRIVHSCAPEPLRFLKPPLKVCGSIAWNCRVATGRNATARAHLQHSVGLTHSVSCKSQRTHSESREMVWIDPAGLDGPTNYL